MANTVEANPVPLTAQRCSKPTGGFDRQRSSSLSHRSRIRSERQWRHSDRRVRARKRAAEAALLCMTTLEFTERVGAPGSARAATTLGYGDIIPVEKWELLGPITAMNGVLMFGWSTAVIFEVLRRTLRPGSAG